ncbi:MAG: 4Fe-4S dicluster domain-containing protein [Anaerolineales bacterium]
MTNETPFDRRKFIQLLVGSGVAMAGLKVARKTRASSSESGPRQWAMVIDLEKCTGCGYCTKVCQAHNDVPPDIEWNRVTAWGNEENTYYLPQPCMHCKEAPCVSACPVKASYYRPDGIVMMDYDRCIGCRYCEAACPYGARSFNWEKFTDENPLVPEWGLPEVERRARGVVEKCSFCYHRIDRGLAAGLTPGVDPQATPACVVGCPVGARTFGDLKDPESAVSKLISTRVVHRLQENLGTEPRVFYIYPNGEEEVAS